MDPIFLIEKYYPPGTPPHRILLRHSIQVAEKAARVARRLSAHVDIDVPFVEEAALLHDIGIFRTAVPQLGCYGELPYLCHGSEGRAILEAERLPRHALVCERHIGVGLTAADIRAQNLPLPARDMVPVSVEERVVTYADLFFSKNPAAEGDARPVEAVRESLARFGKEKVAIFDAWHALFTR